MKVLSIGDYSGDLTVFEAQIKQFIIMHNTGIDVTIQGHFSDEIETLLADNNIPIIKDKPTSKKDILFENRLLKTVQDHKFDIVHVFGGRNTSNTCNALKNTNVKIVGYMGSTSIHWHDPFAYRTYLNTRIDAIICNSESNAVHFRKQLFRKNKSKVHMIYKGYDPDWFLDTKIADLNEYGISENALVIASVGNKRKVKAMDLFIKAVKYVNKVKELDIHFVLVGDHTDDSELQKLKNESPHRENIHLLGYRKDIKDVINRSDIYVQTSRKEGLGRAITESMCLKKPVIVTNAGGCVELVNDNESGYIAKNKNYKSIAEKINLLTASKTKRIEFGNNGYKRTKGDFNINTTVNKTVELYKHLLK